jgi:hypothetical protein
MQKATRSVLLVLTMTSLATSTARAAQDDGGGAAAVDGAVDGAEAKRALGTPTVLARRWGKARYKVSKGKREVGSYVQRNTLTRLEGTDVIEFFDYVIYEGSGTEYTFQTVCEVEEPYGLRAIAGKIGSGQMQLELRNGRLLGQTLGPMNVNVEVPEHFVTDFSLLRGLPRVPLEEGAKVELDYVDLQKVPEETAVGRGTLTCQGREKVMAAGTTFDTWKFKWLVDETRPMFLWYGEEGQLIKRLYKREEWLYDPKEDGDVGEAPPAPSQEPKGSRGKGKKKGKKGGR